MGIDPADCDEQFLNQMRHKFGLSNKPAKPNKKVKFEKVQKEPESDDAQISEHGELDLADMMTNLDKSKTINTTKVKKQLKSISKDSQAKKVEKPLSGVKKQRVMRQ